MLKVNNKIVKNLEPKNDPALNVNEPESEVETTQNSEELQGPGFAILEIEKASETKKREKKVFEEEIEDKPQELTNSAVLALYKKALLSKKKDKAANVLEEILASDAPIAKLILSKGDVGSAMAGLFGEKSIFANPVMKEHLALAAEGGYFVDLNSGTHYWNPKGDMHHAACFIRNTAAVFADMGFIKTKSLPYVEVPYSEDAAEINGLKAKDFKATCMSAKDIAEMHNGYSFEDEYKNGHPRKSLTIKDGEILQTKEKRVFVGNDEESYSPLKKDKKKKAAKEEKSAVVTSSTTTVANNKAAPADNSWSWGEIALTTAAVVAAGYGAYWCYDKVFGDGDKADYFENSKEALIDGEYMY